MMVGGSVPLHADSTAARIQTGEVLVKTLIRSSESLTIRTFFFISQAAVGSEEGRRRVLSLGENYCSLPASWKNHLISIYIWVFLCGKQKIS